MATRVFFRMILLGAACSAFIACGDDEREPAGGGGGTTSSTGAAITASSATTTGSGGEGGEGGQGGGTLCADRRGGALVDMAISDQTLRVWITNDAFIDEALAQLNGQTPPRVVVFDELLDGQDCDPQWTWHPDPEAVAFADVTIELCDGRPSDVETDKPYWMDTVGQFCPWTAEITAVDDRR